MHPWRKVRMIEVLMMDENDQNLISHLKVKWIIWMKLWNIDEVELWSKILTTTFIDEKWPSSIFVSLRPIYVFFPTSLYRPTFKQIGTTFKHNMQKVCYWKTTPNLHLKFFNLHRWFTKHWNDQTRNFHNTLNFLLHHLQNHASSIQ